MLRGLTSMDAAASPPRPLTLMEVYVDDFIGVINDIRRRRVTQTSRAMLHGIHAIFPPPAVTGHVGADPIAEKKLRQGDGTWSWEKEILGWDFDGRAGTIQLPPHKGRHIISLL